MFDIERLKFHCTASVEQYTHGKSCFIDRHAEVLAVAHLDTVLPPIWYGIQHDRVYSTSLDDRLGVYIICDVLPAVGITTDILLTTGEESGHSTIADFVSLREYHWLVEFDRRGTSTVLYQYDQNPSWYDAVARYFEIGIGTYSDIADAGHLGVCALNVGTGYYLEHTHYCYADLQQVERQIYKFARFYRAYQDQRFPFNDNLPAHDYCDGCGTVFSVLELQETLSGLHLCPACYSWFASHDLLDDEPDDQQTLFPSYLV